jgi:nitrogen-specific signal transduction histidine kinase
MPAIRLKLVGEDPEVDRLSREISGAFHAQRYVDLESALENYDEDPGDLFILGNSIFFQYQLNQIQKLYNQPEVILAAGQKLPNLAKILVPRIIPNDFSKDEIIWEIQNTLDLARQKKRLDALRNHHQESTKVDHNPAINLVTGLMRKCTAVEEYKDLLPAVLALRNIIDFHDASLAFLDHENKILEAWHSNLESKDRVREISSSEFVLPDDLVDGEVVSFTSSDAKNIRWELLTQNPWSFGLAIRFSHGYSFRSEKGVKSAVLVLFRRELLPFLERDYWLLETTYGPLALALEKVTMLKAIGQASKEWRSTFDGISEPLTVIDSNYRIVKANKAFAELVDQDIKKLKPKRCFALLAGRRSPCIGCPVATESQPQSGTRIQFKGKSKKDLLVWSYGIRTGMESYHFQFYRNVSKETQLASALIQSEKMAALGRLVGAIAHEINNPLAGILATSQLLLSDEEIKKYPNLLMEDVLEIKDAASRSKKIIEDLLGFTSEKTKEKEKVDLTVLIQSVMLFAKSALKDVRVDLNFPEKLGSCFVYSSSLQQILFNLVTNACHAMNGKGQLTITVSEAESFHHISVRDTGPGIPSERLKYIFDPFHTSKQEGTGTGLGLSIVKNLAQRIGARIEVQSIVGEGTEFLLEIPREGSKS